MGYAMMSLSYWASPSCHRPGEGWKYAQMNGLKQSVAADRELGVLELVYLVRYGMRGGLEMMESLVTEVQVCSKT